MVTPAIPSGHTAIQAVRFTLLSHDQGQAEALGLNLGDNFRGTYQGSHTWFEAAIIRDDREEFPRNLIPTDEIEDIDAFNRDALSREHAREIRNPLKAGTMERWEVQYNVQAVYGIPKMHQVVWMKDDVFNDEVETAARSKGARTGRGFVSMLRPGDRVALVIRAQYHGWRNFIYGAKIEIFHAV
ncbi:hypothetical protein DXG03_005123 [Asterophora parasitica]|uniref:Uncharacterized protein n=1 Tax=Asterophora parasitica TaxID=117018 RepID=A0A9P7K7N4_9AGAR|nr:hypothetical protein DXG03_005123 [Asterophora parasitica]